jgi:hypothetical protein
MSTEAVKMRSEGRFHAALARMNLRSNQKLTLAQSTGCPEKTESRVPEISDYEFSPVPDLHGHFTIIQRSHLPLHGSTWIMTSVRFSLLVISFSR